MLGVLLCDGLEKVGVVVVMWIFFGDEADGVEMNIFFPISSHSCSMPWGPSVVYLSSPVSKFRCGVSKAWIWAGGILWLYECVYSFYLALLVC